MCVALIIIQKLLLKSSTLRWAHKALFAAAAVMTDWYRKSAVTKPAPASALLWVWSACCWLWRSRICCQNFDESIDAYVVCPKQENFALAFKTAIELRRNGFKVEYDFNGRSMKSQMKQANKFQAKQVLIFGEDELSRNAVTVRNMATSEQHEIAVNDIISYFNTL